MSRQEHPPASRPTIYDVAERAGVSKSLVSRVLNGEGRVSPEAAARVREAIAALGYRPRRAAADLAASRTRVVGVLIDDYANPWFVDLLAGLAGRLTPQGYRLSVVDAVTSPGNPVDGLLSLGADGVVLARDVPDAVMGHIPGPVVVAGTRLRVPEGVDTVANDDALGAQLAVDHLLGLGHREIGHLAVGGGAGARRREGFVEAMAGRGHAVQVGPGPGTEPGGYAAAKRMLAEHPEVTALFAANDVAAIGALGAAKDLGLRVPEDLSVVGYDNTELAGTRLIDLTTVDDDSAGVGREAASLLLERMAAPTGGPPGASGPGERRVLTPRLVLRGTTAPPPVG